MKLLSTYKHAVIFFLLISITIYFGIKGYFEVLPESSGSYSSVSKFIDVISGTLLLFTFGSSPESESVNNIYLSIARLAGIFSSFYLIALGLYYAFKHWFTSNIIGRYRYRQHIVVVGLNEESLCLIKDIIGIKKKVIVVDDDFNNPLIGEVNVSGVPLVLGNVNSFKVLRCANILKAKSLIAFTGSDLKNLSVLKCIIDDIEKPELHCHIGIDNVMSYKLFENGFEYSIDSIKDVSPNLYINVFNLNELAAMELYDKLELEKLVSMPNEIENIQILIYGFGELGLVILKELLLLGHFPNVKKISVTIYGASGVDFFDTYFQASKNMNGDGLDLWDVKFINDFGDIPDLTQFCKIISVDNDNDLSLKNILKLHDKYTIIKNQKTRAKFYYYCSEDIGSGSTRSCVSVMPFGSLGICSSFQYIIEAVNEESARNSHNNYLKSKDNKNGVQESWEGLSLFQRGSNISLQRHIPIKLSALGLGASSSLSKSNANRSDYNSKFIPYLDELDNSIDRNSVIDWVERIMVETGITQAQLEARIHAIAEAEHARWNAFHIMNNWRYSEEKNISLKVHDCLLSWRELTFIKGEYVKYDYLNIYNLHRKSAV